MLFFLVQMHHTQPLRCVMLRSVLRAVSHDCTNVSYTYYAYYYRESGARATSVRACTRCIPGVLYLARRARWRGNWALYEVRRRDGGGARRRMVGSWIEAKVCEAGKLRAVFCFAAF